VLVAIINSSFLFNELEVNKNMVFPQINLRKKTTSNRSKRNILPKTICFLFGIICDFKNGYFRPPTND